MPPTRWAVCAQYGPWNLTLGPFSECCCSGCVRVCVCVLQAQGLCLLLGGKPAVVQAVQQHRIPLAAHGPYTAAGAGEVLGLPVPIVSKSFSTFHGLVTALAEAVGQH